MAGFQTSTALDYQSHFQNIFKQWNWSPACAEALAAQVNETGPGKNQFWNFFGRIYSHTHVALIDWLRALDAEEKFWHLLPALNFSSLHIKRLTYFSTFSHLSL